MRVQSIHPTLRNPAESVPYLIRLARTGDGQATPQVRGEVRDYAGGQRRSVSRVGGSTQLRVPAFVTSREKYLLEQWVGETVLYRDGTGDQSLRAWGSGKKLWVVFYDVPHTATVLGTHWLVDLTLHTVTYDENV